MSKITKAVIPAAGQGKRMRPLTNYLSKAMLPLGKKPVLQHIIDELKMAGINEIAVILNPDDELTANYFKVDKSIHFIFDDSFSGPGGAILKAEKFVNEEDFIVAFSDAPLKGQKKSRVVESLISLKKQKNIVGALAIYPIKEEEISKRGIVKWSGSKKIENDESVLLSNIIEKPESSVEQPWASACRYVFDANIFDALKKVSKDDSGEVQLTPAISQWLQNGKKVVGYSLPEGISRFDVGNFKGYFEAQQAFMQ